MLYSMQPEQQPTTPPPDLSFILQSEPPKPKRLGGESKTQRMIIVGVASILLIIIAFLLLSVLQARSRRGSAELIDLAAYQTEMTRVLEIGAKNGRSNEVLGGAQTGRLAILSDLIRTKKMIASLNVKLVDADLLKYESLDIDTALDDAKTANNFDTVFSELIDEKYVDYKQKLSSVYKTQNNTKIKNTLSDFHGNAGLLPFSYSP